MEHIPHHCALPCSWQESNIPAVLLSQVPLLIKILMSCLWIKCNLKVCAESGLRGGFLELPLSMKALDHLY